MGLPGWAMGLRHQRDRLLAQSKDRQNGAVEAHMCIIDQEHTHVRACLMAHRPCQAEHMCAQRYADNEDRLSQAQSLILVISGSERLRQGPVWAIE